MHFLRRLQEALRHGQTVRAVGALHEAHLAPRALELGRDRLLALLRRDGERDEGRGHVDVLEGAAHAVLAADGSHAEVTLCTVRSEQRRKGLAPALRLAHGLLEILLESEINFLCARPRRDQFRDAFDDGEIGAVEGALFADKGVKPPGHERTSVCFAIFD